MKTAITNTVACLGCFLVGTYGGYNNGINRSDLNWKQKLIDKDFAEYNRKTGEWEMRPIEDIVTTGIILGKGKPISVLSDVETPAQVLPLAQTDSQSLSSRVRK